MLVTRQPLDALIGWLRLKFYPFSWPWRLLLSKDDYPSARAVFRHGTHAFLTGARTSGTATRATGRCCRQIPVPNRSPWWCCSTTAVRWNGDSGGRQMRKGIYIEARALLANAGHGDPTMVVYVLSNLAQLRSERKDYREAAESLFPSRGTGWRDARSIQTAGSHHAELRHDLQTHREPNTEPDPERAGWRRRHRKIGWRLPGGRKRTGGDAHSCAGPPAQTRGARYRHAPAAPPTGDFTETDRARPPQSVGL